MWTGFGHLGRLCVIALASRSNPFQSCLTFSRAPCKSTTTTKTKVKEVINSYRYRTGYEYTASGTNVAPDGAIAPMSLVTTTNSLNKFLVFGVVLILRQSHRGKSLMKRRRSLFAETLNTPGLIEHTIINRETDVESITETLSTFTQ